MESISKRTQESGAGVETTGLVAEAAALTMASTTTTSPVTSTAAAVLPTTGHSTANASLPSSSSRSGKAGDGGGKVSNSQFPSEEICVTDRNWEQINETNDFYDNKVEIVQEEGLQQFVFTYRCANMKGTDRRHDPCLALSPTDNSTQIRVRYEICGWETRVEPFADPVFHTHSH